MRSASPLTIALADPRWRLSASVSPAPLSLAVTRSSTPDTAPIDEADQAIMQSVELEHDPSRSARTGTKHFDVSFALNGLDLDHDDIDFARDATKERSPTPRPSNLSPPFGQGISPSPEQYLEPIQTATNHGKFRWWCCQCWSDYSWDLNAQCVPVHGSCNHQRCQMCKIEEMRPPHTHRRRCPSCHEDTHTHTSTCRYAAPSVDEVVEWLLDNWRTILGD